MAVIIRYIRHLVFTMAFLIAVGIFVYSVISFQSDRLLMIRLTQYYALTALTFLYFTLLASPLYTVFPVLPWRSLYLKARKALGISAFFFALFHGSLAFFGELGGFNGLFFLNFDYLLNVLLGFISLTILTIMAITSINILIQRLGKFWKPIHRLVYIAGIMIMIHALLLGTHFGDISGVIPQIFFAAVSFLLILEAVRFDRYLMKRFMYSPQIGITLVIMIGTLTALFIRFYLPSQNSDQTTIGLHAQHIKMAQQIQNNANTPSPTPQFGQLTSGDKTLRYSVSYITPPAIEPAQQVQLRFKVSNAVNGDPVLFYSIINEKPIHLIIVDESLTYFHHIHPKQDGSEFVIDTSFPHSGLYRLYITFQPQGAFEQQFAFTQSVGKNPTVSHHSMNADDIQTRTKTFGNYEVTINTSDILEASKMSVGQQKIIFTIKDASSHKPVDNLKPYLGAFGHLVLINTEDYSYIHVHPDNSTPLTAESTGGPVVSFIPLGLQSVITPGKYKVFAEFNPNGTLIQTDFMIDVQ